MATGTVGAVGGRSCVNGVDLMDGQSVQETCEGIAVWQPEPQPWSAKDMGYWFSPLEKQESHGLSPVLPLSLVWGPLCAPARCVPLGSW